MLHCVMVGSSRHGIQWKDISELLGLVIWPSSHSFLIWERVHVGEWCKDRGGVTH